MIIEFDSSSAAAVRADDSAEPDPHGQQDLQQDHHGAGGALLRDADAQTRGRDKVLQRSHILW